MYGFLCSVLSSPASVAAYMLHLLGTVDPKNFLFTLTYNFLLIIVLGGMGSITGSMLGSIIVTAGLEFLRVFDEPFYMFRYQHSAVPSRLPYGYFLRSAYGLRSFLA